MRDDVPSLAGETRVEVAEQHGEAKVSLGQRTGFQRTDSGKARRSCIRYVTG